MQRRAFLASAAIYAGLSGCLTDDTATPTTGTRDAATDPDGAGMSGTVDGADGTPVASGEPPTDASPGETATGLTETLSGTARRTATPPAPGTQSPRPAALEGYDATDVRVTTPDGEHLGRVRAAISDTADRRYTGLSDVTHLPDDWGMLFVYDAVGSHTYVMREMDFGIDIVYADDEGTITEVHQAPEPGPDEDGSSQQYPGTGQYVFEVTYEWTSDRGVEPGDVLRFEL
jgi:uncharacterized membrane protein (UPF0127 family)